MSGSLTLSGTIPGLLRPCSPGIYPATGQRVTVLSVDLTSDVPEWRGVSVFNPGSGQREKPPIEAVALDLTDTTGRYHAVMWLAGQLGFSTAGVLARFSNCGDFVDFDIHGFEWDDFYDAMDYHTDERLADGSYRQDAEALRRVVLHIAGVLHA